MGELERLVTGNEIFQARTRGVGYIDAQQAVGYGLTGPMLRASGARWCTPLPGMLLLGHDRVYWL
jgi:NADH:ubiquinone oxidoreductase subunit D